VFFQRYRLGYGFGLNEYDTLGLIGRYFLEWFNIDLRSAFPLVKNCRNEKNTRQLCGNPEEAGIV
jgi:hypothetical protein